MGGWWSRPAEASDVSTSLLDAGGAGLGAVDVACGVAEHSTHAVGHHLCHLLDCASHAACEASPAVTAARVAAPILGVAGLVVNGTRVLFTASRACLAGRRTQRVRAALADAIREPRSVRVRERLRRQLRAEKDNGPHAHMGGAVASAATASLAFLILPMPAIAIASCACAAGDLFIEVGLAYAEYKLERVLEALERGDAELRTLLSWYDGYQVQQFLDDSWTEVLRFVDLLLLSSPDSGGTQRRLHHLPVPSAGRASVLTTPSSVCRQRKKQLTTGATSRQFVYAGPEPVPTTHVRTAARERGWNLPDAATYPPPCGRYALQEAPQVAALRVAQRDQTESEDWALRRLTFGQLARGGL